MKTTLIKNKKIYIIIIGIIILVTIIIPIFTSIHHKNLVNKQNAFYYEYRKSPTNYEKLNKALFVSIKYAPNRDLFKKSRIQIDDIVADPGYKIFINNQNSIVVTSSRDGELATFKRNNDGTASDFVDFYTDYQSSAKRNNDLRKKTEKIYFQKMKLLYDNWVLYK